MNPLKTCKLCPRECNVDRTNNELGFCKLNHKLKIAKVMLHYWEEPCFSNNNGSGTIFFSGCNLKCIYCQNYNVSTNNLGTIITINDLSHIFIDLQEKKANNINLVTPTPYIPQIIKAIKKAKKCGLRIPIIYNCSGYENINALKLLDGYIDIYMPDFKYYDDKYAIKYSKVNNYFQITTNAIKEMIRQTGKPSFNKNGLMTKGVLVRHLMLPNLLHDSKKIIKYFAENFKDSCYLSIMNQYTPLKQVENYPELNSVIDNNDYNSLINYALDLKIKNAFIQEPGTQKESYIPEFEFDSLSNKLF